MPSLAATSSRVLVPIVIGFEGRSFTTQQQVGDFGRFGLNDRASSVVVIGERWEVCENIRFGGRCVVLLPGRYASLSSMGLNDRVSSGRDISRTAQIAEYRYALSPVPAADSDNGIASQITLYEREDFQGAHFTTGKRVGNFQRIGFNDRALVCRGTWRPLGVV